MNPGSAPARWYPDLDSDGYGDPAGEQFAYEAPNGFVGNDQDCDDWDPSVNPDGTETCGDGIDNNCNPATPDPPTQEWYPDVDGDGYGDPAVGQLACEAPNGFVGNDQDCGDSDPSVNPGGTEICGDGIDNDCNPATRLAQATSNSAAEQRSRSTATRLRELNRQRKRLIDAYQAGALDLLDFQSRKTATEERILAVEQARAELQTQAFCRELAAQQVMGAEKVAEQLRGHLGDTAFETKQAILRLVVEKVVVTGRRLEIHLALPVSGSFHLTNDWGPHSGTQNAPAHPRTKQNPEADAQAGPTTAGTQLNRPPEGPGQFTCYEDTHLTSCRDTGDFGGHISARRQVDYLTFRRVMVILVTGMATEREIGTAEFLERHPVFSLGEATAALSPPGGRAGTVRRLKHHIERGRVKQIERGIYAVVPHHQSPERFLPDPLLVARAVRTDAVFAYHSALELLGAGHSAWHNVTVFTARRRPPLILGKAKISFFLHPSPMRSESDRNFATRRVEWRTRILRVTSPERTLVEGMKRTDLVGGLAELVAGAVGFSTLDIQLLREVLERYSTRYLWGATGWFLEKHRNQFGITDDDLSYFKKNRPGSPQYLVRDRRGGTLARDWNVILPDAVQHLREPDAS